MQPNTLITLAGFLLGYPVTYVAASQDQTNFLENVALDIYELELLVPQHKKAPFLTINHVLMKFSCPASLAKEHMHLGSDVLLGTLRTHFEGQLRDAGCDWPLKINHSVKSFDRVAL